MIHHYRVLGAMATLREFDVNELSQLSGVKPATVRTVIGRERSLLERVESTDKTKNAGRGGRYHRYRLKKEALPSLKSKLNELFTQIPRQELHDNVAPVPQVPVRVLAAEDALLRLFPVARTPKEKLHFIHLAEIALDDELIRTGFEDPDVDRHFRLLRAMLELSKAEIRFDREGLLPPPPALSDQQTLLANLADDLRKNDKLELAKEIDRRLGTSVLLQVVGAGAAKAGSAGQPDQAARPQNAAVTAGEPVLEEVERISKIRDRDEQRMAALSAAIARFKTLPEYLRKASDQLVKHVLTKAESLNTPVLTDAEIEVLGTIPGFYFSGVVLRLGVGVCVDMRSFVDAIVECLESFPDQNETLLPRALIDYARRSELALSA